MILSGKVRKFYDKFLSKIGCFRFIIFFPPSVSIQEKSVQTVQPWWKTAGQASHEGMPNLLDKLAVANLNVSEKLEISRSSLPPGPIAEQQTVCASSTNRDVWIVIWEFLS